ncbi:hypothetical protein ACFWY5_22785 [Nonomuraea sp. NPDC059007]|uniref:hypothetical protein n=1 Tax=Nonomuraea sp. NPDC059007 TaxID=3346692 RepID=UPI0036CC48D6
MHHPTEPDKPEILDGPGEEPRRARRTPSKKNKTIIIVASALVVALAAGGAGFFLANGDKTPAGGTQPQTVQQTRQQKPDPRLAEDEDASVGDVTTDAPKDGDTADENLPQDAVPQNPNPQVPAKPNTADPGTPKPGTGKPSTDKPGSAGNNTTAPDNPADGPAGELTGQCAASGC